MPLHSLPRRHHARVPDRATTSVLRSSMPAPGPNPGPPALKIECRQTQWFQQLIHDRTPVRPRRECLRPLWNSRRHHFVARQTFLVLSPGAGSQKNVLAVDEHADGLDEKPNKDGPERNRAATSRPAGCEVAPALTEVPAHAQQRDNPLPTGSIRLSPALPQPVGKDNSQPVPRSVRLQPPQRQAGSTKDPGHTHPRLQNAGSPRVKEKPDNGARWSAAGAAWRRALELSSGGRCPRRLPVRAPTCQ